MERGRRADIGIGIPVYHIRVRAALVGHVRATYDEALPGGRHRGHSSSHHHRGTLRWTVRSAAFMHHYAWYCNNQSQCSLLSFPGSPRWKDSASPHSNREKLFKISARISPVFFEEEGSFRHLSERTQPTSDCESLSGTVSRVNWQVCITCGNGYEGRGGGLGGGGGREESRA